MDDTPRRPTNAEIDGWGASHIGHVRTINQDTFILATVHKRIEVHATNLPRLSSPGGADDRLATLAAVADGIGSGVGGERASRSAIAELTRYITHVRRCWETHDEERDDFLEALQRAALDSHKQLREVRERDPDLTGLATTLTLVVGVWPWIYLLQVGDSRYYLYRDGALRQVTHDQTYAQDLVDQGILSRSEAAQSMVANLLTSAVGGVNFEPVVSRIRSDWNNVHLLCSDGLTRHVPDDLIAERLRTMTSARQVCERLIKDALENGGTDNVTVVVGRAAPLPGALLPGPG